ncbi:MAG: hypothetical protein QGH58_03815 [Arenicellales bacterium]|jgi:predicted permease|nr:hypothetical protein [Arenicellales bacterium]MDP6552910.1 hypothetical protein [Arenicellales bacterium]MDP6791016.1 hypothetical protein [Arenicellales bacterium]MDP6919024.1 hypothetical protein [Arenicellales bacterium]|tara:strand:- start:256 stop:561 length:306 start_codon:yes stop_codon:yes gene_type:complete
MIFNNCGNLGLPLALLAFGDAGLAPAIVLIAALAIQPLLQLPDKQFRQLLLYCALPAAVLVYLVTGQYQQEPQKVTVLVGFGNSAAIIIVPTMLPFILPAL